MADRLLVVSYAFPPIAVPEAVLVAKALHGIKGFEIDVVCAAPMSWHGRDDSLLAYAEQPVARVVRIEVPWWLPAVQPVRGLRRYPDAMRFLRGRARRAIKALGPDRYDAVLTWSQWHSVHLVGLDLVAAQPDLPWMAHFSDPWVDNPLVPLDPVSRQVAARMERSVVGQADAVVFTAEPARRRAMARYPESWSTRSHVLPHLFDEALYASAPVERATTGAGLVVRHLGTFYGDRRPDPLLRALEILARESPEVLAGVRVELIGSVPVAMRRAIAASALPDGLVEVAGRVAYRESLELMRSADVLVAIDAPSDESVFLASKVIDYLGAGRPIVGFVPAGAAATAIEEVGGWVADPSDPVVGSRVLAQALATARTSPGAIWGGSAARNRFGAETVGAQRSDILRHIVGAPSRPGRRRRPRREPQT